MTNPSRAELNTPPINLVEPIESAPPALIPHPLELEGKSDRNFYRGLIGSEEGSAGGRVIVGAGVLAILAVTVSVISAVGDLKRKYGDPSLPNVLGLVPAVAIPAPQIHVSAEAALESLQLVDSITPVQGTGWAAGVVTYKASVAGPEWSFNPGYVMQKAMAVYGTPPPTYPVLGAFKDSKNHYDFSPDPVLSEVVPGSALHLSLGDRGEQYPDAARYFINAKVVDNNIQISMAGIPRTHTKYNTQAWIGSTVKQPDVDSESNLASEFAQADFENSCGEVLNTEFANGIKVEVLRIVQSNIDLLEGIKNPDTKTLQIIAWYKTLLNPANIVVSIVHDEAVTAPPKYLAKPPTGSPAANSIPSPSLPPTEIVVDNYVPPKIPLPTSTQFAIDNGITTKGSKLNIDPICHMSAAMQAQLKALTPGSNYLATSAPLKLNGTTVGTSNSPEVSSPQPAQSELALASAGSQ